MKDLVIVGLSGGVDSAVSAALLLESGYRVEALHMVNWESDDAYCTRVEDEAAAAAVARHLGIVLHRANFAPVYRQWVFKDFLDEYRAGRTPNPDILCNRHIKFSAFLNWALRLGAGKIATGHYARVNIGNGQPRLMMAQDRNKDQTYFLHAVRREALAQTLFPLGDLIKSEVRSIARKIGLPNHARPDSTGICFIGERPFRDFLSTYLAEIPGPIETETGQVLGRHRGLHFYTLGQRSGLGIGGRRDAIEAPWYVISKDQSRRALIVAQNPVHPRLMALALQADRIHWIAGAPPVVPTEVSIRIRHRQTPVPAMLDIRNSLIHLEFLNPLRAVAPGQYAVVYRGETCLGGGRIIRVRSVQESTPSPRQRIKMDFP